MEASERIKGARPLERGSHRTAGHYEGALKGRDTGRRVSEAGCRRLGPRQKEKKCLGKVATRGGW